MFQSSHIQLMVTVLEANPLRQSKIYYFLILGLLHLIHVICTLCAN
jgi:hypothetical protein